MGKLDWSSPQFQLLEHITENEEPLGYALAVVKSPAAAHQWVVALLRAGLILLVRKGAPLSVADQKKALAEPESMSLDASILMRPTNLCRQLLEGRDMAAFSHLLSRTHRSD